MTPNLETCPLCGSPLAPALRAPDRRYATSQMYEVWQCGECGLGVTRMPEPTLAAESHYPDDYEPYRQISRPAGGLRRRLAASLLGARGYPQDDALPLPRVLAAVLATIRCWTWCPPPPPPGKLLDVGCAAGAYGAALQRLGWQVVGIEPNARAASLARAAGLEVWQNAVEETDLPAGAFDAITLWHVLEHLDRPVAVLQRLRPALREGGLLLLETPNREGLGALLAGSYWFHLDLPRHRYHFTPTALVKTLTLAGYRLLRLQHIPNPHGFAGSLAYRLGRRNLRELPLLQAWGWAFGIATAALRRSDIMRAYATPV
ncbi:MAG: methyltransferase domain-containing protein [Caldilineae bacterium]|nr:MAG: methyltransferase domain-containing protein [Caldilineae bacterium]